MNTNKKYKLTPIVHLLHDEASVKFHVESGDYFGTIATVLGLLEQQMKKDGCAETAVFKRTLNNLKDDLMFLQKNYEISRRAQIRPNIRNKKSSPKGRLKSQ